MHELKITGDTPEVLYLNVVKTLSMFLRGPTTTAPVEREVEPATAGDGHHYVREATTEQPDTSTYAIEAAFAKPKGDDPLPTELTNAVLDKANAKTAKEKKTAKAKVEKMENDDISDVGGADKTIEHESTEKKPLTLEADIIPRLQAIQAACTKRGLDMPSCVKYIQKLYGPFGIANAKQLKPDQFEEFLEASEAYLNGDA